MLYYLKKGKNATEMQKKFCAVYEQGAVTDQLCQKCFAKFFCTIDTLAKKFFAVELSCELEDVQ